MHKLALVAILATIVGCTKKDEPKPAAEKPTETVKAPEPPPKDPGVKPADPNAPCVIAVKITDTVTFDGGGVKGSSPLSPLDLATLKPLAGKCSADVTAEDKVVYQDVIHVMDALVQAGIPDVNLGGPGSPKSTKPRKPPATPAITGEWSTTKDGKLQLTGHFEKPNETLKKVPVIILTKTEVKLAGKTLGKVDDAGVGAAIEKALPPNPTDPTLIIQADAGLPFAPIRAAIDASAKTGYDNVLFAVKNK